jgi:hypothetical protein
VSAPGFLRALALALLCIAPRVSLAQSAAAFRFSDLDLRDPHLFVNFIGFLDVTDTAVGGFSVNGELQTRIQTDGDADGNLDLSYLVEFLPLDPAAAINLFDFGGAQCTAPLAATTCSPVIASAIAGDAAIGPPTACLAPEAGTLRPYAPAVVLPTAPCFTSPTGTLTLDLGGVPVTLRNVALSARFVGDPANALSEGLLRGFISEADADNTVLPANLPLVGGRPLSSLLAGGTGACPAHSDKDVVDGVTGWWFYLNFPASRVAVTGPPDAVFAHGFEP